MERTEVLFHIDNGPTAIKKIKGIMSGIKIALKYGGPIEISLPVNAEKSSEKAFREALRQQQRPKEHYLLKETSLENLIQNQPHP